MKKTMFKGIRQVPPGSYLSFSKNKIQLEKFSNLNASFYGDEIWNQNDTEEKLVVFLDTASGLYLNHSKHSQAIYLSGGIDSTLMTQFLQKNSDRKLDTFTLFDAGSKNWIPLPFLMPAAAKIVPTQKRLHENLAQITMNSKQTGRNA